MNHGDPLLALFMLALVSSAVVIMWRNGRTK